MSTLKVEIKLINHQEDPKSIRLWGPPSTLNLKSQLLQTLLRWQATKIMLIHVVA